MENLAEAIVLDTQVNSKLAGAASGAASRPAAAGTPAARISIAP
jgi:hypothetical protein